MSRLKKTIPPFCVKTWGLWMSERRNLQINADGLSKLSLEKVNKWHSLKLKALLTQNDANMLRVNTTKQKKWFSLIYVRNSRQRWRPVPWVYLHLTFRPHFVRMKVVSLIRLKLWFSLLVIRDLKEPLSSSQAAILKHTTTYDLIEPKWTHLNNKRVKG